MHNPRCALRLPAIWVLWVVKTMCFALLDVV
jgi:hypothetical protein